MSITKKETPPNSTTRPACMPSKKDDGFLPPINLRATPSSDSDTDYRKDQNGRLLLSNENSSLTPSPVKFPSIGRSISTSVSSLSNNRRKEKDRRELLCRSPSCPSNIGGLIDHADNSPDREESSRFSKDDTEVKLPNIFKDNSKSSCASYATPRTERKHGGKKKTEKEDLLLKSRDASPEKHIAEKIAMGMKSIQTESPRGDSLDTNRSTQCALLLPLRNNSMRKSKRKRKNGTHRQNTQLSIKSESAANDGNSVKDIITCSKSEYDYDTSRHDPSQNLSESDIDLHSDKSSEGNPVHPTYHVTKQMSNKHQIRMKDMANVKV